MMLRPDGQDMACPYMLSEGEWWHGGSDVISGAMIIAVMEYSCL